MKGLSLVYTLLSPQKVKLQPAVLKKITNFLKKNS
jgi:hypothetical protein